MSRLFAKGSALALACASALMLTSSALAQVRCSQCETRLELDEASWACLTNRLNDLASSGAPVNFFTLSNRYCPNIRSGPLIPSNGAPGRRVYILSQDQVRCLIDRRNQAVRSGGMVRFDLAGLCPRPGRSR